MNGNAAASAQVIGTAGACATSRAQADLEQVHAAMYAWYLDIVSGIATTERKASDGIPLCPGSPPVDVTQVPPISVEDLRVLLVPQYISAIPAFDPWEHPYEYRLNLPNLLGFSVIALRSAGADGLFEGSTYEVGTTNGPSDDLLIYNTTQVRQPPRLDPVSRQEVTVERIDQLGAALLSYWTDVISGAQRTPDGGPSVDLSLITPISAADLAAILLTPFYTLCVPAEDGWGHLLDLRMNDNPLVVPFMSIRSPGRDGITEGDIYDQETFPADNLDRDLVWSDGTTYQAPSPTRAEVFTDDFETATLWGTWSCGPGF
ncbi:MAG: hypothetical protein ABI689_02740 [Thermoanaerobaculia bacterium]